MKDPRIFRMKLAAESDFNISSGAFRLLSRLASDIYTDKYRFADEQFPLDYKSANRLLGSDRVRHGKPSPRFASQSKATIYSRIKELEQRLYIKRTEARGCPCVWFYKLNLTPYERK
jgi:hypothetical protein